MGTPVYTLRAVDPEGLGLRYGIMGTDKLAVDDRTGVVTVVKPIDREVSVCNEYTILFSCNFNEGV